MNCLLYVIRLIATKELYGAYVDEAKANAALKALGIAYEIVNIDLIDASNLY